MLRGCVFKMFLKAAVLFSLVLCISGADDRVVVGFYGESLCPDCIHFATIDLTGAFIKAGDIFTLHYVPWGNAKFTGNGKFECQHGPMECLMNTVEACALHYYPSQDVFWPFLKCMYGYGQEQSMNNAEKCATTNKLDWDKIESCTKGDMGRDLELKAGNETRSLQPPQHYTPWVTINGKHNTNAEGSGLIKEICAAYTGDKKVPACSS